MKKHIKGITLMMTLGLSLMLYTPNLEAGGDDPAKCPAVDLGIGIIYNMKNKRNGECKVKCNYLCDVGGAQL